MKKVQGIKPGRKIESLKSCYILEGYTYWANEDFSTNETVVFGPFLEGRHEENLFSLIETCERMSDDVLRQRVINHKTDYSETLGYSQWFENWITPKEFASKYPKMIERYGKPVLQDLYIKAHGFQKHYPHAIRYDSSIPINEHTPNGLMNYRVYYYDENGNQYQVEIEWNNHNERQG